MGAGSGHDESMKQDRPKTPRPGLATAMRKAGYNGQAFADALGVRASTVSEWVTGTTGISTSRRPAMAHLLKISQEDLNRLIDGEPFTAITFAVPGNPQETWVIDVDRLPRRRYDPAPAPAVDVILNNDPTGTAQARAEHLIDQLLATVRVSIPQP